MHLLPNLRRQSHRDRPIVSDWSSSLLAKPTTSIGSEKLGVQSRSGRTLKKRKLSIKTAVNREDAEDNVVDYGENEEPCVDRDGKSRW
jgi:hypothetical protein